MGLRHSNEIAFQLLEGVQNMRGSTIYQAVLQEGRDEGRAIEAQRLLLRQGGSRFGTPHDTTQQTVESIQDLDRMERMSDREVDMSINEWTDLLNTP
jgi:predicted transposase YdaD